MNAIPLGTCEKVTIIATEDIVDLQTEFQREHQLHSRVDEPPKHVSLMVSKKQVSIEQKKQHLAKYYTGHFYVAK